MILGKPDLFAVEFEIEDTSSHWLFGKFCYWIGGCQVGDYSEGTALGVGTPSVEWLVSSQGKRYEPLLFTATALLAFMSIDVPIYGPDEEMGDGLIEIPRGEERLGLFKAEADRFDIFRSVKAYLIEGDTSDRLLWKELKREQVHEVFLPKGLFFDVLREFVRYMYEHTPYGEAQVTSY
jgi:hypothetical protein